MFNYTGTPPFAVNFDYLGYEGRHQIVNLGTLTWLICLAVAMFLLTAFAILLAKLIKPCGPCYTKMMKYQLLPAVWFRMFLQLYFVILLCSLISFCKPKEFAQYPGLNELHTDELTVGDLISKISTAVSIAILGAFTAFMVVNANFNRSFTAYKYAKMEALAASDILFAFRSTRAEIIQKFARLEAAKGFTHKTLKDQIKKVLLKN